jgi:chorismate dehydratase
MRIGRIPYINCYPVYGAIDRNVVPLNAEIVTGVPSLLNKQMAEGNLDISVVSAVEYARDARKYLLLPDLAISCDGPVRSVLLLSKYPATDLGDKRVIISRSSMTSVALLNLLFREVWQARPDFVPGDAEVADVEHFAADSHDARLVIGDAALHAAHGQASAAYPFVYDLGAEWKAWTGLPFVFAVWVAQRTLPASAALGAHATLINSRNWGLDNLDLLVADAASKTGIPDAVCREYFRGLDYGLGLEYLAGLTDFFARLARTGEVPHARLTFLTAA